MVQPPPSLLLLGAGNMGGALLRAWLSEGSIDPAASSVIDPNPTEAIAALCEEHGVALNPAADRRADLCVLAVKPQMFADVLPGLDLPGAENTVFVSIAAGTTLATIRALLKGAADAPKVVRTMPSLPAQVRRGITLLTAEDDVTPEERDAVTRLMAAAGETYWCTDEDQLDRLMGVTGCSPAYLFLLAEALADAAVAHGADEDAARRMGEAAVTGAAALLAADGRDASTLRRAVTSPGGTTAAALEALDGEYGLRPLIDSAVTQAYHRARALAGASPPAAPVERDGACTFVLERNGERIAVADIRSLRGLHFSLSGGTSRRPGDGYAYHWGLGGITNRKVGDGANEHADWGSVVPAAVGDVFTLRLDPDAAGEPPSQVRVIDHERLRRRIDDRPNGDDEGGKVR